VYARRARLRHCDTNSKNVLLRGPDLIDRPAFVRSSQSSKHLRLLFELRVKQAKSRPISRVSVLTFFGSKLLLVDYAVLTSITREIRAQRLFKWFLIAVQGMSGMDYESEHVCLTMNRCAYGRPAQKSNTSQMTSTF